jgi:hypothetical protein
MLTALIVILLVAHLGAADFDPTVNFFVNPGAQDFDHSHIYGTYPVGSTIHLEWETIWETVTLVIWQDGPQTFQYLPNARKSSSICAIWEEITDGLRGGLANATSYTWSVDLGSIDTDGNTEYSLDNGETFFFGVFQTGTTNVFESQYINITDNTVATSSASSTSSTSSTSPTSSMSMSSTSMTSPSSIVSPTQAPASTTPSPSPSPSATQETSGGLSTGAKTGLGVGLGVGIAAIVAGVVALILWNRRKKRLAAVPPMDSRHSPYVPEYKEVSQAPQELPPAPVGPRVYEM